VDFSLHAQSKVQICAYALFVGVHHILSAVVFQDCILVNFLDIFLVHNNRSPTSTGTFVPVKFKMQHINDSCSVCFCLYASHTPPVNHKE